MAQLVARLTGGQEAVSSSLATRTISPTAVLSENGLTPRFFRIFAAFCGKSVAKVSAWPFGCRPRGTSRGFSGRAARAFSIWRLRVSWGAFFAPFWRRAGETPVKLGEKPGEGRFTWALPGFGPIFLQGGQKSLRLCGKIRGRLEKNPGERGERRTFPGPGACVFLMGI